MTAIPWMVSGDPLGGDGVLFPSGGPLNKALKLVLANSGYDVTTTFSGFLGPVVNVRAYGATPGINCTTAIRNAIISGQLLYPGGFTLYFPAGTYQVTNTLTLPANCSVCGEGVVSEITGIQGSTQNTVFFASAVSNISISNLKISGQHSWAVFITGGAHHKLLNCDISGGINLDTGSRGGGCYLENVDDAIVDSNYFHDNGALGMSDIRYADIQCNSGSLRITNSRISRNRCLSTHVNYNIAVFDPYRCRVLDNEVSGAYTPSVAVRGGYGVLLYNTHTAIGTLGECIVRGNGVHDVEGCGIYNQGVPDNVLTENIVKHVAYVQLDSSLSVAGIAVDDVSHGTICATNVIDGSGIDGLQITGPVQGVVATNNVVKNSVKRNISIRGQALDAVIMANFSYNPGTDSIASYSDDFAYRALIIGNLLRTIPNDGIARGIWQAPSAQQWVVANNILSDMHSRAMSLNGSGCVDFGNIIEGATDIIAATDIKAAHYKVGANQVVGPRGAAVADATGAGDVIAQLNALLARCRAHGLIA